MSDNQRITNAARELGLEQQLILTARKPSDERVEAFLRDIDRCHRQLAREHHPDVGGSEERMKRINAARDVLRRTRFAPQPVPTMQWVRITFHQGPGFAGTSTSSTATSTGWGSW